MWPEYDRASDTLFFVYTSMWELSSSDFYLLCRVGRKWMYGGLLFVGSSGCLAWTVLHLLGECNIL